MGNHSPLLRILIIGSISTMEFLGLEPLIAISIVSFAHRRVLLSSLQLKFILLLLFQLQPSLYLFADLG